MEDLPGFKKDCEDEPLFDEANLLFYDNIERMVEEDFKKAAAFLWPLLKDVFLHSIKIGVDILGIMIKGKGAASYFYERADKKNGNDLLFLHRGLLIDYLRNQYEKGYELSAYDRCPWEHELIHLLDDDNIQETSVYRESLEPEDILKFYLLKYRVEGIAELS